MSKFRIVYMQDAAEIKQDSGLERQSTAELRAQAWCRRTPEGASRSALIYNGFSFVMRIASHDRERFLVCTPKPVIGNSYAYVRDPDAGVSATPAST